MTQSNVCEADIVPTNVSLLVFSKISETVKYGDRMLFLLAYSHYPYKCICIKKIIFIFTGSDNSSCWQSI